MADLPVTVIRAIGGLLEAVAALIRERPPDAAARLQRATVALTSRAATAEAARRLLRKARK